MAKPGKRAANLLVIRFVNAMLILASHCLRNRIMRTPVAAMAMIMMAPGAHGVLLIPTLSSVIFPSLEFAR